MAIYPADNPFLHYRAIKSSNREVFLLQHESSVRAFMVIDQNFHRLGAVLQHNRDNNGKSYVSFIPFVLIMQRQARAACESLSSYQSYEAWVLLRPCLEVALTMGKWVDDSHNAEIWKNRDSNREAYQRAYSGRKLRSTSLPRSDAIQTVLSRVNDSFMHTNPAYYDRHTTASAAEGGDLALSVQYFDEEVEHRAHLYSILHLVLIVQDSVCSMLKGLFSTVSLGMRLDRLEEAYRTRVDELLSEDPSSGRILAELGLWDLPSSSSPEIV